MNLDPPGFSQTEFLIGLLILILALVAAWLWNRSRRSARLKSRFGPEYERAVHEIGDEGKAEAVLADRKTRVSGYAIRPLSGPLRDHLVETWRTVPAQFVDDPNYAVTRADDLVGEVMSARAIR